MPSQPAALASAPPTVGLSFAPHQSPAHRGRQGAQFLTTAAYKSGYPVWHFVGYLDGKKNYVDEQQDLFCFDGEIRARAAQRTS